MSEAMSSVEIEDVLSSIRRLVSEDLRPGQARHGASRLLLTPALRVVPGRDAAPETTAETTAETAPEMAPDPVVHHAAFGSARLAEEEPETQAFAADPGPWPQADTMPWPQAGTVPWPQADTVEVDLDDVEDAELVEEPLHLAEEWREDGWMMEAAAEAPPAAPMQPHLADLAEAAAVAEILSTPPEAERRAEPQTEFLGEEDFLIDEDVVRDLVRDIIREELQGALGERITRNVRKLVRAELNRALLARDLS